MLRAHFRIASWPAEDNVVAELLVGAEDVGHVCVRDGGLELTLYRGGLADLTVGLSDFVELLSVVEARLKLS
jgi:hypothetical protein